MNFYSMELYEVLSSWLSSLYCILKLLFWNPWTWIFAGGVSIFMGSILFILLYKEGKKIDKNKFFVENVTTA